METPLYTPAAPAKEKRKAGNTPWIIAGIATLFLLAFMIWKFGEYALSALGIGAVGLVAVAYVVGAVLLFILAVFWAIFPWMVYVQLKRIEKAVRESK